MLNVGCLVAVHKALIKDAHLMLCYRIDSLVINHYYCFQEMAKLNAVQAVVDKANQVIFLIQSVVDLLCFVVNKEVMLICYYYFISHPRYLSIIFF